MDFGKIKRKKISINVTSLIDVEFILLIFVLLTSSFLQQPGLKLDLPISKASSTSKIKENVLTLAKDRRIYLNDKEVSKADLLNALKTLKLKKSINSIILKADKSIMYGYVVSIMDIIKKSGISKIIIATRIPKED